MPIKKIVIVGGGTAGWMTAVMLKKVFSNQLLITLVESPDIPTVGVGEATIPAIQTFNKVLGLDEFEFLKRTHGTYKLGIQFENWGKEGDSYLHAFGDIGRPLGMTSFHHFWLQSDQSYCTSNLWNYSVNAIASKANKFHPNPQIGNTPLSGLTYAYHFDANEYGFFLKEYALKLGVEHIADTVDNVLLDHSGAIKQLELNQVGTFDGDFFIDCTGGRALLIGKTLRVDYESYQQWLLCDSAVAIQSENKASISPYTRAIARDAGWQWHIPLQNRTGNGLVYSSKYFERSEAELKLMSSLEGEPLTTAKHIQFLPGRREKQWYKNCLSIGLSSGFLEPLESTSLHLVQSAISRFIKLFPNHGEFEINAELFNEQSKDEFEKIRDFIILHYYLNSKDLPFWQACRDIEIPKKLQQRIEIFNKSGVISVEANELFSEVAWLQVLLGQGVIPGAFHPLAKNLSKPDLDEFLNNITSIQQQYVQQLPSHQAFLQHHCL